MITEKAYKRHPESYWMGKTVRTLITMSNGNYVIPKGTLLTIDRKYLGFSLRGLDICPHCQIGRKIAISRVEPECLQLVLQESIPSVTLSEAAETELEKYSKAIDTAIRDTLAIHDETAIGLLSNKIVTDIISPLIK